MTEPPLRSPEVPGLTGFAVLARGGFATVFSAVQSSLGRPVAVKVENRTLDGEVDRQRYLREARAAARMSSHSYVVDLFDAGVAADGHPYLVMELCAGSYADRIAAGPLPPAEVREVGVKIADALADAHRVGVLHRDVKPGNILITEFGEPTLADFGLAIVVEARDTSVALDAMTPAYAPPEALRQSPPAPSGDVYSLCATLYAMLGGRPAGWHDGWHDGPPSDAHLPVKDLPGVPAELMAVLRAGMRADAQARPTARQLSDALAALALETTAPEPEQVFGRPLPGSDDPTRPSGPAAI